MYAKTVIRMINYLKTRRLTFSQAKILNPIKSYCSHSTVSIYTFTSVWNYKLQNFTSTSLLLRCPFPSAQIRSTGKLGNLFINLRWYSLLPGCLNLVFSSSLFCCKSILNLTNCFELNNRRKQITMAICISQNHSKFTEII